MNQTVLLVVDIQNLLVWEHPFMEEEFIHNTQSLIQKARTQGIEIVYVRHDDGQDTDLTSGKEGWEIYQGISPRPEEKVIDKFYNSAFYKTNLAAYLKERATQNIILVGMQTEYCIDATLRSAFELDYKVIIPRGANTTYDNGYMNAEKLLDYYHNMIWNNRYANVVTMEEALAFLEKR